MLKVQKLHPNAIIPQCAHPGEDLGYDLFALEDTTIRQGPPTKVRTGLAMYFQPPVYSVRLGPFQPASSNQWGLLIMDRSSMALKGLYVVGGAIDAGYRGEVHVLIGFNHFEAGETYKIKTGDKIAQIIPMEIQTQATPMVMEYLAASERGSSGFGSTGQ